MAVVVEFRAEDLLEAFGRIASVLDEHATALNDLDLEDGMRAGSDISATMSAAVGSTAGGVDLVTLISDMAEGASEAARGPAGSALTGLLRAFAGVASSKDALDAEGFALALEDLAEKLEEQHGNPQPGRLIAVVEAASVGALSALDNDLDLVEVVIASADAGLDELESGLSKNSELAAQGTVDAAGAAFLLLLDSFAAVINGDPLPHAPVAPDPSEETATALFRVSCTAVGVEVDGPTSPACDAKSSLERWAWLEGEWRQLGEIKRFEVAGSTAQTELDTREPGRAIEILCSVGRPTGLSIGIVPEAARDSVDALDVGDQRLAFN